MTHDMRIYFQNLTGLIIILLIGIILISPFHVVYAARGIGIMPITPDGTIHNGNNWLMVIGINQYSEWPKLSTAVNDAQEFKSLLINRYYFNDTRTLSFYDYEATRSNIINGLKELALKVSSNDQVVIFYAGHGYVDDITNVGSWIPVDAGLKDASARITNFEIKSYMKVDAIKAKHILLISDSCFSGDFFRGNRSKQQDMTPEKIKRAWQKTSRMAITSGGLEPVVDKGFKNHSVFTHFLIQKLKTNQSSFLPASDLFDSINSGVIANASQTPLYGILTDTGAQVGGEYIFFLNQSKEIKNKEEQLEDLQHENKAYQAHENKIQELDRQIMQIKQRMKKSSLSNQGNLLDELLQKAKEKEAQQQEIEQLKVKYQLEKVHYYQTMYANLSNEVAKYNQLSSLPSGKEYLPEAWQAIVTKFPEIQGVSFGDTEGLLGYVQKQMDKHKPKPISNSIGMSFVWIPPGTFMMGSPSNEPERGSDEIQHEVTLTKGYYLQTTEVTQGQWKKVMGNNPSGFKKCGEECPVERVSWDDVQEFIKRLNQLEAKNGYGYRLPTEAEWEYAARAGSKGPFAFGNCLSTNDANYYGENPLSGCPKGEDRGTTIRVSSFKANAWGLYDMHGNVWEWCQDVYGDYPTNSVKDPQGPTSGGPRVCRGGSWSHFARICRSAFRSRSKPGYRINLLGFRAASQR